MATYFKTEKVGRNRTNIIDAATDEHLCQLLNREVPGWIARATRARDEEKVFAVERRARRVEIVREYLATRAARRAEAGIQLSLF